MSHNLWWGDMKNEALKPHEKWCDVTLTPSCLSKWQDTQRPSRGQPHRLRHVSADTWETLDVWKGRDTRDICVHSLCNSVSTPMASSPVWGNSTKLLVWTQKAYVSYGPWPRHILNPRQRLRITYKTLSFIMNSELRGLMYRTTRETQHVLESWGPTYSAHGNPQLLPTNSTTMHKGAVYQHGSKHCITLSTPNLYI